MKAEKRGNVYRVRASYYDTEGKQHCKSFTAPTEAQAISAAEKWKESNTIAEAPVNKTVGDIVDDYIKFKEGRLSPSTIDGYRTVRRYKLGTLYNTPVSRLTPSAVQRAIDTFSRSGASPKTVSNTWGLISSALKKYAPDKHFSVELPHKQYAVREIPTEDEIRLLIDTAKNHDRNTYIAILFGACLGMRMSEVLGLHYRDVNIDKGTVYINSTRLSLDVGMREREYTKTDTSTRLVSLPGILLEALSEAHGEPDDYIVDMASNTLLRHFHNVCDEAGVQRYRFHDLRHYNASVMISLDVPAVYMRNRGGWKTNHIMDKVYSHTMARYQKESDERINEYFNTIAKNEKQQ